MSNVYQLELDDFWCDSYTWQDIVDYNKIHNHSKGIGACYRNIETGLSVDTNRLFGLNNYGNNDAFSGTPKESVSVFNVIQVLLFLIPVGGFGYLFCYYLFIACIDLQKTINNDWSQGRRRMI